MNRTNTPARLAVCPASQLVVERADGEPTVVEEAPHMHRTNTFARLVARSAPPLVERADGRPIVVEEART